MSDHIIGQLHSQEFKFANCNRGCTAYPSLERENLWIMNKKYLLFLLLLRIPSPCQLPPNFWEVHRPSPTSPSPILWLNNHCEINDADPSFVPCDPLQCYFQWFSRVGAHLENATGAPETPSHVHFHQKTWSDEKRTPPWRPPSFIAGSSQITGDDTCKNDGKAPEYMTATAVNWLYDDQEDCCEYNLVILSERAYSWTHLMSDSILISNNDRQQVLLVRSQGLHGNIYLLYCRNWKVLPRLARR